MDISFVYCILIHTFAAANKYYYNVYTYFN